MSLAEKSRINLLYLICSKEIINAGRFKKSVGVRYFDKLEFTYSLSINTALHGEPSAPAKFSGAAFKK
jgi:hypothetical protein